MSSIQRLGQLLVIFLVTVASSNGYPIEEEAINEVDPDYRDFIDLSAFGSNAFIEPDDETTGKLVAEYKEDSDQNPEELGTYFEGDILMPNRMAARNGLVAKSFRWPNGVVPYEITGKFTPSELAAIESAFEEYHRRTCIRFKPRSREKDYISIRNGNTGCWSAVGRMGGKQVVNLQTPTCLLKRGTALHELMHSLGFIHEQNRHERDNYITVRTENIKANMMANFVKSSEKTAHGMGIEYDYSSVMHYSPKSFSKNGRPTIEAKKSTIESRLMGQRNGFSTPDVAKINLMYKCQPNDRLEGADYEIELEYIDGEKESQ